MKYEQKDLYKSVVDAISDKLAISEEKVTLDAHLVDDLGADSLDLVELVMEIEERFDLTVDDHTAEKIYTVKSIVYSLKDKVPGRV